MLNLHYIIQPYQHLRLYIYFCTNKYYNNTTTATATKYCSKTNTNSKTKYFCDRQNRLLLRTSVQIKMNNILEGLNHVKRGKYFAQAFEGMPFKSANYSCHHRLSTCQRSVCKAEHSCRNLDATHGSLILQGTSVQIKMNNILEGLNHVKVVNILRKHLKECSLNRRTIRATIDCPLVNVRFVGLNI